MTAGDTMSRALERGRAAYERQAWGDAFEALSSADRLEPLPGDDLERLARAAVLAGHDDAYFATLERLHDLRNAAGEPIGAARAAFWLGFRLLFVGEAGRGTAWLGRAESLLEHAQGECVERGYLMLPAAYGLLFRKNDAAGASALARDAIAIGERCGDLDLTSLGRMIEGQAEIALAHQDQGLARLDQAMLPATRGMLSPMVTGIVYCAVIGCCQRIYAIDRSREWTKALAAWCDGQPQLAAFTGLCRVHRSEILLLQGDWSEAIHEAERVATAGASAPMPEGGAAAHYQRGEVLRLRGEFAAAEAAYREASRRGREPQPGLALLRLAQGQGDAAAAAIRLAVSATPDPLARARYLPAAVEILLAVGDEEGARAAAHDLETLAAGMDNDVLAAMAAHARGAVRLADGDARGAIEPLRAAFATWHHVGAPYLAARLRTVIADALAALGDDEGAALERDAARFVFTELGAKPDLARLDARPAPEVGRPFGLTPRELEVLRLVASGRTNKAISLELFLSEKTIDRHVSNIFTKLDVSTRAAATAFAYQHKLV